MRVLIVDDDPDIRALVVRDLRDSGFTADAVASAEYGLEAALNASYSAIVIDRRLPDGDGLDLVRTLRRRGVAAPILVLTARRAVADRVDGLASGADDYLCKPFAVAELRARLKALQRRGASIAPPTLAYADIVVDPGLMEASVAGEPVPLSRQGVRLLELLVQRGGHVVPKRMIEERLYGYDEDVSSNSVEVHVHRLRHALRAAGAAARIETWRGVGYRLARPA